MAQMGMDVDLVETASKELKARANDINTLASQIDSLVNNLLTIWEGPDAKTFVDQWWPEHKKQLLAASSTIEGLGQSAWNNAQEQRNVSNH
ncbi:MAG TPA: hypothetical protein VHZ81_06305 [Galbitalea sp.]|jgi:uncharacterized protein YukE|nr:hypothetical protein [Galbitalea sp.]